LKKVLVIDSNKALAADLVLQLKAFDFRDIQYSVFFENSCIENIFINPPDIVFIRIGSKSTDGFYIGKKIRKENANIKVVYISDSKNYATEAFEAGAMDYLLCPISKERLEITLLRMG
jgi:two-component SAPR family response regulator